MLGLYEHISKIFSDIRYVQYDGLSVFDPSADLERFSAMRTSGLAKKAEKERYVKKLYADPVRHALELARRRRKRAESKTKAA